MYKLNFTKVINLLMGKTNSKSPLQDELDKFRRAIAMGDL